MLSQVWERFGIARAFFSRERDFPIAPDEASIATGISRVLEDPALRQGAFKARRLSWTETARKTLLTYARVLESAPARH